MAKATHKASPAKAGGAKDRDTAADVAAAKHKQDTGHDTITQHKRSLADDGLDPHTMESVGEGSITEKAPAVRAQEAQPEGAGKVVQQGADVLLHTHNPLNGKLETKGKILKVNGDGSVAIRADLGDGRTEDFTSVGPTPTADTNPWFELQA